MRSAQSVTQANKYLCEVVQWMFEVVLYWQHRLGTVEAMRSRRARTSCIV